MTLTWSTVDGFQPEESLLVTSELHLQLNDATLNGAAYEIFNIYNLTDEVFDPMEAGGPIEIQFLPDCIVP